jgi:hypothetical protein
MKRKAIRLPDGKFQGRERQLLTAWQLAEARRTWLAGESIGEIARCIGVTVSVFNRRLCDQLADLPARPRRTNSGRRGNDPTEEEIYGRLTMLEQQNWSDEEREKRWKGLN